MHNKNLCKRRNFTNITIHAISACRNKRTSVVYPNPFRIGEYLKNVPCSVLTRSSYSSSHYQYFRRFILVSKTFFHSMMLYKSLYPYSD